MLIDELVCIVVYFECELTNYLNVTIKGGNLPQILNLSSSIIFNIV